MPAISSVIRFSIAGSSGNGQVTWAETAERSTELQAWLDQGLQLRSDAGACRLQPTPLMASERADGIYLSAESAVVCPGSDGGAASPAGLTLRYQLIFERDNLHRGLIRVQTDALQTSAVLSPDQPELLLVPGSAQNFKVTYPEDFALAEAILRSRS